MRDSVYSIAYSYEECIIETSVVSLCHKPL